MVSDLIAALQKGEEAKELLEAVWTELGPYPNLAISEELRAKLNNFVDFDDSE